MLADRALCRCLRALADIAAVQALPDDLLIAAEDLALLHIREEDLIALVMLLLDLANCVEETGNLIEALFACHTGKLRIHARPLAMLAGSGIGKVFLRVADTMYELEPDLGMCLLVARRLVKDVRDLLIAILLRLRSVVEVLRMCLRLTRKRCPEVLFCL